MTEIKLSAPDFSTAERDRVFRLFDDPLFLFKQDQLREFAEDMCAYTGFEHAYPVASGTAAMHLAMIVTGIGPGDHVWSTSMTFMGGISPVTLVGAIPTFIDLDAKSWSIDCDLLEEELAKANRENRLPNAIVSTDLYGQASDMDRLVELCERYGVLLISDTAEALGARYKGRHAGKGAKVAILSFNNNKVMATAGGGMVLSDEKWITDKANKLANQARENVLHYQHEEIGYNYRMSQISAAIGIEQLKALDPKIERRRVIFERYQDALGHIEGVSFMPEPDWSRSTRWLTCMVVDKAKAGISSSDLISACTNNKVETRPLWKPMHMQPVFQRMGAQLLGRGLCEALFANGLCIPSGSTLTDSEQDLVIETIAGTLKG